MSRELPVNTLAVIEPVEIFDEKGLPVLNGSVVLRVRIRGSAGVLETLPLSPPLLVDADLFRIYDEFKDNQPTGQVEVAPRRLTY